MCIRDSGEEDLDEDEWVEVDDDDFEDDDEFEDEDDEWE